jgi:hypothetical protein
MSELMSAARFTRPAVESLPVETIEPMLHRFQHDLNNLVTVLVGNAFLMKKYAAAGRDIEPLLDSTADAARRAKALTRELYAELFEELHEGTLT